jgi:hypothetical protein
MASDDRKTKTKPAPKSDTLSTNQSTPDAAPSMADDGVRAGSLAKLIAMHE